MLVKGSFEDYLYILVGIIWVAFSIYKGLQKKKTLAKNPQVNEEDEGQEKKKSFFDQFLNEIIKEEPVPYESVADEETAKETVIVEQEKTVEVFSYDDAVEESNFKDVTNVYENKPTTDLMHQQELKSRKKSRQVKPRFDLRKAVIYSEILNRRYF